VRSTGARLKIKVDARALGKALLRLPPKVRMKTARVGLRKWGRRVVTAARRRVLPQDRDTRRDMAVKVKSYKRGKVLWAAVGVRRDGMRVGWRSHFWDVGFRVWQKGIKADGTPKKPVRLWNRNPAPKFVPFSYRRDWRKGIRKKNLGQRIGRRLYMTDTHRQWAPKADEYVRDAIAEALRGI
jgi:hypothetical protein